MNKSEIGMQKFFRHTFWSEFIGFGFVNAFELFRHFTVNLMGRKQIQEMAKYPQSPLINPDSPLFPLMQNAGDLWDAYLLTWVGYHVISKLSLGKTSEGFNLGLAAAISSAIVVLTEMGEIHIGKPDILDIPAGLVGVAVFSLIHCVGNKLIESVNKNNPIVPEESV